MIGADRPNLRTPTDRRLYPVLIRRVAEGVARPLSRALLMPQIRDPMESFCGRHDFYLALPAYLLSGTDVPVGSAGNPGSRIIVVPEGVPQYREWVGKDYPVPTPIRRAWLGLASPSTGRMT